MLPQRKRNRLIQYDYSTPHTYFITICTHKKQCVFGKIQTGDILHPPKMILSAVGEIAFEEIQGIERHYENIFIDRFVVMPNHIHLLIRITERINPFPTTKCYDIPNVVGKFKAAVTRRVGEAFMPSAPLRIWQTSFHDHIVRDEKGYAKIAEYIENNPAKWKEDCFYIP